MSDLALSAAVLCDRIQEYTGITTAGEALKLLNDAYARLLAGVHPVDHTVHVWSFLRPLATLTLPTTRALTITSIAGTTLIQATAGEFDVSMVGQEITIAVVAAAGVAIAQVVDKEFAILDEVVDADTGNAATVLSGVVDLPADFAGMLDPVMPYHASLSRKRLKPATPNEILTLWQDTATADRPEYYAIIPKTFVAATGQRWQAMIAPLPENAWYWTIPYRRAADALTDAAVYAAGGAAFGYALFLLAMCEAERYAGKKTVLYEKRAYEAMAEAIAVDRQLFATPSADEGLSPDTGM